MDGRDCRARERCHCVSALPVVRGDTVMPRSDSAARVFIETGRYDIPFVEDARALRRTLERRSLSVRYFESAEGHNHSAFRARLPSLMERLFPVDSRE